MTLSSAVLLERMLALHPSHIDLTLGRIERLLGDLGDPHHRLPPVIHIAGTNGKGSVQAMLRAGLEAGGAKVHAYTSPHILQFHERIRVAGTLISEAGLADVLERTLAANGDQPITFFEATTCAGFLAFSENPANWTLLEVGLGGRLDATNVVQTPALTMITPVSLDHQDFLGDRLDQIAFEKAGILKSGITCVVSRQEPEAREAIEARADAVGAPLLIEGQDWQAYVERDRLIVEDQTGLCDLPRPALPGDHQISNAGAAVVALRNLGQNPEVLEAATQAVWPGRLQAVSIPGAPSATRAILDVGHNAQAAMAIRHYIEAKVPMGTHKVLCLGMLKSRDPADVLAQFDGLFDEGLAVDLSETFNGHGSGTILKAMQGSRIACSPSTEIAPELAGIFTRQGANPTFVLFFGSFHVAEKVGAFIQIPGLEAGT